MPLRHLRTGTPASRARRGSNPNFSAALQKTQGLGVSPRRVTSRNIPTIARSYSREQSITG